MEPGFKPRLVWLQSLDSVALCYAHSGGGGSHKDLEPVLGWALGLWCQDCLPLLWPLYNTQASTPSTLRPRNFWGVSHGVVMALLDGKERLRKVEERPPGAIIDAPTPLPSDWQTSRSQTSWMPSEATPPAGQSPAGWPVSVCADGRFLDLFS